MDETQDRYAGDGAWRQWFEICSVAGCGAGEAARLRAQIVPAMMRRLAACGVSPEETQGEDPVAFFDAFFRLKGSREGAKPLKLWFAHRIRAEGLAMRDFVCGTLFGAASGRVHDIVVDWIAALKGWKPRTLRDADGRRRLVWEGAAAEEAARTAPVDPYESQLDAEAELLARVLYGVKDNDEGDLKTYCWCVFNRVENKAFPDTLEDVIAQPSQWMRYDQSNPIIESLFKLAREQLDSWHMDTHRPVSNEYVFMSWSAHDICLRDNFYEGSVTHYWRYGQ